MVFAESNLHVKKILRGFALIFPILKNSQDLSHKRPWKILGMVWVKGVKKRLGVRVVFRFDFEGASPALSIIGQFDRLAFDGCINRFSRLGSLTAAAINKSKGSIVGPICDDLSPICDELKASIPLTNRPGFRRYSVTAEITGSNSIWVAWKFGEKPGTVPTR